MRNTGIKKLQYLFYALLTIALAGCGASNLANLAGNSQPGSVSAQMVYGASKNAAKTVNAAPAGVTSILVTITGTDLNGKAIPVVRGSIDAVTNQGTVGGIYPGRVTMAVKAMSGSVVSYEGFAIGVAVNAGATTNVGTIVMSPPTEKAQDMACIQCHETTLDSTGQNLVAEFKQSAHYDNQAWTGNVKFGITGTGCAGCHGPSHNDVNPATGRCAECHVPTVTDTHHSGTYLVSAGPNTVCSTCHNSHNPFGPFVGGACIACHAFPQDKTAHGNYVNDNNGVRAITAEFSKWSHHVTGVTLNSAHCAACHLEGKIVNGAVTIDTTKHMSDAKIHLRNADTDADMQWDPASPSFSTLDNFCLSCHDGNGATSAMSAQIQAFINSNGLTAPGKTASASNPFGDTISNQYDKMQRPAVVDAAGQFNPTNNSHHAVLGQKYSGRTRVAGPRQIAAAAAFNANSSATMPGARSTIYDAGRFNSTYVTLGDAAGETVTRNGGTSLGDDSTLHCADCHTVGQYRVADVGVKSNNNAVIGAHGANNEYLLRNNAGTDARHIGLNGAAVAGAPYLVCFNCHNLTTYTTGSHAGELDTTYECNGPYDTFGNYTASGTARLFSRTTAGVIARPAPAYQGYGNIFGIQCANCHNSGADNGYGGIHGSKIPTYTDGIGNTTKHRRFMPGINNTMFVPGTKGGWTGGTVATYKSYSGNRNGTGTGKTSGQTFALLPVRNTPYVTAGYTGKVPSYQYITGGVTNDLNWEQKTKQSIGGMTDPVANAMGCYTLGAVGTVKINALQSAGYPADDVRLASTDNMKGVDGQTMFGNWGGCDDHNSQPGSQSHSPTRGALRPVTY